MFVLTVVSFVIGLALLIGVHEYGHYRMAVACGVRVIRFSIGFGPTLWGWTSRNTHTEYVLCAIPLGGYVRMLDEREGQVDPSERAHAFNTQPLHRRALIVVAGPLANFLLAIALYAGVFWSGVSEIRPILASPAHNSMAQEAGLKGGERVISLQPAGGEEVAIETFEALRWHLTRHAIGSTDVELTVQLDDQGYGKHSILLPLSQLALDKEGGDPVVKAGLTGPWTAPILGDVMAGGAAQLAGLQSGDVVLKVDATPVTDGQHLRSLIRSAATPQGKGQPQRWHIRRDGRLLDLEVTPKPEWMNEQWVGRIGAYVGSPPERIWVSKEPFAALMAAADKTWEVSALSLRMLGKMLTGEASIQNLSGPLTIADYAGKTASTGMTQYLLFLALISVSLGVLNLLPLPMLDGGHLMYYLYEGIAGRPVPDVWLDRFQSGGVAILMGMMFIALYNDVTRLLG